MAKKLEAEKREKVWKWAAAFAAAANSRMSSLNSERHCLAFSLSLLLLQRLLLLLRTITEKESFWLPTTSPSPTRWVQPLSLPHTLHSLPHFCYQSTHFHPSLSRTSSRRTERRRVSVGSMWCDVMVVGGFFYTRFFPLRIAAIVVAAVTKSSSLTGKEANDLAGCEEGEGWTEGEIFVSGKMFAPGFLPLQGLSMCLQF